MYGAEQLMQPLPSQPSQLGQTLPHRKQLLPLLKCRVSRQVVQVVLSHDSQLANKIEQRMHPVPFKIDMLAHNVQVVESHCVQLAPYVVQGAQLALAPLPLIYSSMVHAWHKAAVSFHTYPLPQVMLV